MLLALSPNGPCRDEGVAGQYNRMHLPGSGRPQQSIQLSPFESIVTLVQGVGDAGCIDRLNPVSSLDQLYSQVSDSLFCAVWCLVSS